MVVRFSTVLVSTETCSYLFLLITLESGLRIVDDIFRGIRVTDVWKSGNGTVWNLFIGRI